MIRRGPEVAAFLASLRNIFKVAGDETDVGVRGKVGTHHLCKLGQNEIVVIEKEEIRRLRVGGGKAPIAGAAGSLVGFDDRFDARVGRCPLFDHLRR